MARGGLLSGLGRHGERRWLVDVVARWRQPPAVNRGPIGGLPRHAMVGDPRRGPVGHGEPEDKPQGTAVAKRRGEHDGVLEGQGRTLARTRRRRVGCVADDDEAASMPDRDVPEIVGVVGRELELTCPDELRGRPAVGRHEGGQPRAPKKARDPKTKCHASAVAGVGSRAPGDSSEVG
jgi:hypothetical protein